MRTTKVLAALCALLPLACSDPGRTPSRTALGDGGSARPPKTLLSEPGTTVEEEFVRSAAGDLQGTRQAVAAPSLSVASFSPAQGSVGQVVALNGTGFSPVLTRNSVGFGPLDAVVIAASGTEIRFVIPAGAVSGRIRVSMSIARASRATS